MKPLKHKYHATPTYADGYRFDSKAEARYYVMLKHRMDVLFFLRQVPIHLPGGVVMRIDFQVFYRDGSVEMIDVKGYATQTYLTKKKIVEALYPFKIKEVRV